ncbi:MAG: hypothetical protein K6B44_04030 [Lachnospiraceae bacterium]|nr:hypothetical protein [Lachnospiraceae bacterium]
MGRPWEEKNYTEQEMFYTWGPEKAPNGVTREQFYDAMIKNGWTREGDERIIANMYWLGCHNLDVSGKNPDYFEHMMNTLVPTDEERKKLIIETDNLENNQLIFDAEGRQKLAGKVAFIRDERRLSEFRSELLANGFDLAEDDRVLDVLYECSEKQGIDISVTAIKYDIKLEGNHDTLRSFLNQNIRKAEQNGWFKGNEDRLAILKAEYAKQDKIASEIKERQEKENELKKTAVLRKYLKFAIDHNLDEMEDSEFLPDDDWGLDLKVDTVKMPEDAKNALIADINAIDFSMDGIEDKKYDVSNEVEKKYREALKKHFGNLLSEDDMEFALDYHKLGLEGDEMLKGPDAVKKKLIDGLFGEEGVLNEDMLTSAAREAEMKKLFEANPALETRRDHIDAAKRNLLSPILRILHDPRNAEFVENVKKTGDTESVPLYYEPILLYRVMGDPKEHDEPTQEQNLNIMARIASYSLEDTKELYTKEQLDDGFWNTYSRTLSDKEIKKMQDMITELYDKGLNWDELLNTSAYNRIMHENGFKTSEYHNTPYNFAKRSLEGKEGIKELKETLSIPRYDQVIAVLTAIEKEYAAKGNSIMDMDVLELSGWFNSNGYDMIRNTILMTNGFEEKIIDGKSVKLIDLSNTIDDSKLDRDLLDMDSYNKLVSDAKEAQKIYNDNKTTFREMFDVMGSVRRGNLDGEILGSMVADANMSKKTLAEMNRFRHLLYGMKVADADVCKLVDLKNNKKNVLVQPLAENTEFTKDMVKTEKDYLDTCIEMLKEPTTRVKRSSSEYWNVIDSINDMKKSMDKEYASNEEAKRAYIKSVNKVLNDINKYREHKAKDGVKNDATHDKLIALERVDKLLRTRYKILEQREYEDNISGISELFKIEVEKGKMGDEYLLDKALQKINNMNKSLDQLKAEFEIIDEETAGITRSNTIGTTGVSKQTAADILTSMEPVKKSETEKALDKLEENVHLKAAEDKEQIFRNKLDPNDDYGKEKLIASAEKELYMASVKEQARLKTVKEGPEAGEKLLNSRMSEIEKGNNLRYRTFKFESLTDNDFNKEFRKKVIEGAANGKTGSKDILKYADEALSSCYKKSGKNTQYLDGLSATLGSKVNSKTFKNKVSLDKLKQDEDAKAPKKEAKKEDLPIKRSRTFDETKNLGKENGPKKK